MPTKVKLSDIVDALEVRFEEMPSFLDCETGRVETVQRETLRAVELSPDDEDDSDSVEALDPEWEVAKRITFNFGNFLRLPTSHDIHE